MISLPRDNNAEQSMQWQAMGQFESEFGTITLTLQLEIKAMTASYKVCGSGAKHFTRLRVNTRKNATSGLKLLLCPVAETLA